LINGFATAFIESGQSSGQSIIWSPGFESVAMRMHQLTEQIRIRLITLGSTAEKGFAIKSKSVNTAVKAPGPPLQTTAQARSLADFCRIHDGESIVVCGCGESLNEFAHPERFITIGVNDVGRRFDPNYLVVVNPRTQFTGDRFHYVETSRAEYLFTQLDTLGICHPHIVKVRLGNYGGTQFSNADVLHYTQNSPYIAMCLAAHMGAKRIGLIGVDFTDHHFFAATGRHPLVSSLTRINTEYRQLGAALAERGVEIVNLSPRSRLTAFPKQGLDVFLPHRASTTPLEVLPTWSRRRVFFVHYHFLSCGDVFRTGLMHAAADLKLSVDEACCDDPGLAEKVQRFKPDLLFVVHGRRFSARWGDLAKQYPSAVWLLDEPYEVDDTSRFSGAFQWVFINDPSTLHRHANAHYLPVCFDPHVHFDPQGPRPFDVGFVGGGNPRREQWLNLLAEKGLLTYVVGGPWHTPALNRLCRSPNLPAHETAKLYRQTKIVINIFRQQHHYNRENLPATALNPRVYESLGCGAWALSERRPEVQQLFPDLPVFEEAHDLVIQVKRLLQDDGEYIQLKRKCQERLHEHSYASRLTAIMNTCFPAYVVPPAESDRQLVKLVSDCGGSTTCHHEPATPGLPEWKKSGDAATAQPDGVIRLSKPTDDTPGSEQGLSSCKEYSDVELTFDLFVRAESRFIAKLHHADPANHLSNSYHLYFHHGRTYFARHNHIFGELALRPGYWHAMALRRQQGVISVVIDEQSACRSVDFELPRGHAFLGVKGGDVFVRNVRIRSLDKKDREAGSPAVQEHRSLYERNAGSRPRITIVSTVYDRAECLRQCLQSVSRLSFSDYEQIVVSDAPPPPIVDTILKVVMSSLVPRVRYVNLTQRANDWGITPASVGLSLSRAQYVAFLSDDNGYAPDHFHPLVATLETDPGLGFVYSSCLYDGRLILNYQTPGFGRIDLGQPLFRRELFDLHLAGTLPFKVAAWDWQMVQHFINKGVRYRHINRPSFIFRLAKYPQFLNA
jgi:hypothetical protein